MGKIYKVSAPATSANLGPGFDRLALAVDLRLTTTARRSDRWTFDHQGEGADLLPTGNDNLVAQAYDVYCHAQGWPAPPLSCRSVNEVPVSRGLGSSATAIVSGMALAQIVHGEAIDHDVLFAAAAKLEGHPDNVAGAVYGGLQYIRGSSGAYISDTLKLSDKIQIVLGIPDEMKSTETLRQVIPDTISGDDEKRTTEALASLLIGLQTGDAAKLKKTESDRRHQPYRLDALPSSQQVYDLFVQHPLVAGAYLSGAGTTIGGFIVGHESPAKELNHAINDAGISGTVRNVNVTQIGASGVVHES